MTTLAKRGAGTPATTGTTWTTVTNAVDGTPPANPATYAVWTSSTSGATATIEVTGYDFATIPTGSTINSVTVTLRHFENNATRIPTISWQVYDGATTIGAAQTVTVATAAADATSTRTVTLAQLKSATFKVRATATRAAVTQSATFNVDHIDVTVDYTAPVPAITQAAYRFYTDGTETASTALASQDTAPTVDTSAGDVNLQVRARLQSTDAIAVAATDDWQLQWERNTSGTWTDVALDELLLDSYPFANGSGNATFSTNVTVIAQSFMGDGKKLAKARFWLMNSTGTASVTAVCYAHTATFGSTGVGTGTALATSTNSYSDAALNNITPTAYDFTFDRSLTLAAGTPYVIGVAHAAASGSVFIRNDTTSPTHPGNRSYVLSSAWTAAAEDLIFEVYTAAVPAPTTVLAYNSANLTDGAATTNRLGAGTGSFVAGKISEDGLVDDLGWTANNHTEVLYSVTLKQADLAPTDTVRFRVVRNGATTGLTYTQTPTMTIAGGGPTDVTGTATGSMTIGGTASGVKEVTATATGTLTVAGTASGSAAAAPVLGTATGTLTVTGVAAGVHGVAGTAVGSLAVAGAAAGQKTVAATATGQLAVAGTAVGVRGRPGTATGALTVAGVAAGTRSTTATATGSLSVAGVASGAVSGAVTGQAAGSLTVMGVASGIKTVTATATGQLAVTGVAVGVRRATGIATGSLSITGVASGQKVVTATAAGTLTVSGTATGQKTVRATATGQIVVASIALGLIEGNAVGRAIGQLTIGGTATGRRGVIGTPTGAITVVGLATGHRATTGSATGLITVAGIAVAIRATTATATGTITVAGVALGHIPIAFDIQGEWNGQAVDAMQWGDTTVVDWYMLTPT